MLSDGQIKAISARNQAAESNTAREYLQNAFLSRLYQEKDSEGLLFKGGTALRIVYGSPRYSEDLDYSSVGLGVGGIERVIGAAFGGLGAEGFDIAPEYHRTSGGLLVSAKTMVSSWPINIELNVSLRAKDARGTFQLIDNPYIPAYTAVVLEEEQLVAEKADALLSRGKPRDYYDLYYILRSRLAKKPLIRRKDALTEALKRIDDARMKAELKAFLPQTHWRAVASMKENLRKELSRL
jgi:predicted nucleotidyltransferase component of viral defense system